MKKSLLITTFMLLVSGTAQANDIQDISDRLDADLQEAREAITQPGRRSHRFNKEKDKLAIQRNVVRPTRGDITVRKDTESLRRNIESDNHLDYAIKQRQKRHFYRKYIRTNDAKNRLNQIDQHNESRFYKNTPQRSTRVKRTGAFKNVPNYAYRRHFSQPSSIRTNGKQVFRRRAVDYYLNGGYADSEVLNTGVIKSSEHKINRNFVPTGKTPQAKADVLKAVRVLQKRSNRTLDKIPTGYQKRTELRGGAYIRSYTNPYQFQYLPE